MTIPQFKVYMSPSASYQVGAVLNSGYIGQGEKVEEFEQKLKQYLEFDFGITVNSATSALWLALHLIGVGPGDKVISTPMTCSATNEVIHLRGAEIIWSDIDQYGNINPEDVARKMDDGVKAVMAVDWGGLPCDYDALRVAAQGVPIIEDAAHSFGAYYKDKPISVSGGDYVAFSFQAIKHLTAGDGGLLVTPPDQYERAKLLRWYGLDRTKGDAMRCYQDILEAGYKFHMNDINASIGLSNITSIDFILYRHRKIARLYDKELMRFGLLPPWPKDRKSSFWLYTIHLPNAREFEDYSKEFGGFVSSKVHNRNDYFSFSMPYRTELPNLDKWFDSMICIPCGWWLSEDDVAQITETILEWIDWKHTGEY